ncbi:hypothetical protein FC98_GL001969 [Lentilactobacillus kisonensis DSM 19906 = JCM 15041]|uniref:Uncharacterized protein n=2 Tax=Lentilactobacillus kisonensis TaxID=481722 RepID=H1LDT5_9LACO|nr:hypothetical protein HMPREF9104_00760 [Lentilactobacillus kisonensis F0435]KRL22736.1 hypothetical protein FC98_GL001969 [Lentilactobacillus kisonensis DSM 19906 = JCM 15041]
MMALAFKRIALITSSVICVIILLVSVNLGLLAITLLFAWITYQLLVKRDYTLLASPSITGKDYQDLDKATIKKYQTTAFWVGWLALIITILIVIFGIIINQ